MNTNWIAALACGAALALAGCSSNPANPAPGGGTPPGEQPGDGNGGDGGGDGNGGDGGGDTDPPEPDDALATALDAVDDVVAQANRATDDAARAAALRRIGEVRGLLEGAEEALQAEFNRLRAAGTDPAAVGEAQRRWQLAVAALDLNREGSAFARLRAAEGGIAWSGQLTAVTVTPAPAFTPLAEGGEGPNSVVRTRRTDAGGGVLETRLTADKLAAVMHEEGKFVMRPRKTSSDARLRMRGYAIGLIRGGTDRIMRHANNNLLTPAGTGATFLGGLTITNSGLVIDLGNSGRSQSADLRVNLAVRGDGSTNNRDLKLTFGRPAGSPTGSAEHYWTAALMPTAADAANSDFASFLKDGTQTLPLGLYEVRLTSLALLDANLEGGTDAARDAADDDYYYLSHAAYGFLDFVPVPGSTDRATGSSSSRLAASRSFPFHVGHDAFKDETGERTTDIPTEIISGKFKGTTTAQELALSIGGEPYGIHVPAGNFTLPSAEYNNFGSTDALRLRGKIELTATISETAANNKIIGRITDLQQWDTNGYWEAYGSLASGLTLGHASDLANAGAGTIAADGSFSGTILDPGANFSSGGFAGSFYGPKANPEAAGAWYLNTDMAGSVDKALVGSFGAARVDAQGEFLDSVCGIPGPSSDSDATCQ